MNRLIIVFLCISFSLVNSKIFGQNIGINSAGTLPNNSAGLDVDFTNKGLLVPRIALVSAVDATTIASPATSLLIYNTATAGTAPNAVTPGYYYWSGTAWTRLATVGSTGTDWTTTGNSGTNPITNFLGTTDNNDLAVKTNNTEKFRVTTNGRIGVNETAPNSSIHVRTYIDGTIANPFDGIKLIPPSAAPIYNTGTILGIDNGSISGTMGRNAQLWNFESGFLRFGTNNTERMRIDLFGNVGINEANPAAASTLTMRPYINGPTGAAFDGLRIIHPSFAPTTTTGFILGVDPLGIDATLTSYQMGNLTFGTVGNERMRITPTGTVAIGTASSSSASLATLVIQDNTGPQPGTMVLNPSMPAGTLGMLYGVATGSSGLSNGKIWNYMNGDVEIGTNGVEVMRVSRFGRVGINNITPAYDLDVTGNGNFTGALHVAGYTLPLSDGLSNQVIKTDGGGNLSWTNSGSVNFVDLLMPSVFNVSGGPITTGGTFNVSLSTQAANTVFAGPASGAASTPTFRSLVAADIPTLAGYIQNNAVGNNFLTGQAASYDITGNAEISGTLEVNGNVGIGTTTPLEKLHIAGGHALLDNNFSVKGLTAAAAEIKMLGTNGSNIRLGDPTGTYFDTEIYTSAVSGGMINMKNNSGSIIACFRDDFKAGIGTGSPLEKFHVSSGHVLVENNFYYKGLTPSSGAIRLIGTNVSNIQIGDPTGTYFDTEIFTSAVSGSTINMKNNLGNYIASFHDNGLVGIGTFMPTEKLHVASGHMLLENNYFLKGVTTSTNKVNMIGTNASNIQIGDPTGTYYDTEIFTSAVGGGMINMKNNFGTLIASFHDNGNVGIGTFSSTFKLEVGGTGKFSSNLTVGNYTFPTSDGTNGQVLKTNGSGTLSWANDVSGSSGTVTSVGLAMPSIFTVSGSPVTTSGTLTATLATQTANTVFAGPGSGAAASPTFRALVAADIPALTGYIQNNAVGNFFATGQAASIDITGDVEVGGTLEVFGNVGVGTTTPTTKMDVIKSGGNPSIPGLTSTGIMRVGVATNEGLDIGKMAGIPYAAWMQSGINGTTADPLSLQPSGGNTGIGTTTTNSILEVNGPIAMKVKTAQIAGTNNPDNTGEYWFYTSGTGVITLPIASTCTNRVYVILNNTGATRTISSYKDLSLGAQTTIANNSSLWVVSDGTNWQQIK